VVDPGFVDDTAAGVPRLPLVRWSAVPFLDVSFWDRDGGVGIVDRRMLGGDGIVGDCRRFRDAAEKIPPKKSWYFDSQRYDGTLVASTKVIHESLHSPVTLLHMSSESVVPTFARDINCASSSRRGSLESLQTAINDHQNRPSFNPPNKSLPIPFRPFASCDT